ncbi:MAG: domain S-box-containing protein, partial [Gemmatimonadales bacterium]|nr:domain S-box-containing protein [Gemmatimonadales bacterium]
ERLLGRPLDVAAFLHIAIPLTAALGHVHARGLIHKDVKPTNILVDTASGGVWLTGFGIASRLPREHQTPAPPEVIAGTLPYMAPEQTGRMNRSVDSRSDLYSLGVTFYEMLTGTLPFTARDSMEWVHCHIARKPVPPSERVPAVPDQLSAIVMKLLAKTGEDRYQTASGLAFDLQRCLTDWEAFARIDAFPLGGHDVSDRLLIPEQLYGREREIDTLSSAFDRVVTRGATEMVLVSGYSGIGKSSVVHELHKTLVPPRGLFASGKFDQYKRDIPYATLAEAFQSLVRPLLGRSEKELGAWRDALCDALGSNAQLIVNLVPDLELVLGSQPPVPELPPQDAKNRFHMVFRRFVGVFARREHPLALFLDDLQWLDIATLELIEHLMTHSEVRHLLLIGAYRNNEVGPSHPLLRTLGAIRGAGATVHEIVLAPLGLDDMGRLIADALHSEPDSALPLAQLVHEKTGGNPFFAIQFFTALADDGSLAFHLSDQAWQWDIERIRAKNYAENVVDLMAAKLKRLSVRTQEALSELACLGNVAEIGTLTLVRGQTAEAIDAALWEAVRAGLIFRREGVYTFLHDRIQQAAYSLIPEARRAEAHLRIGRALLAGLTTDELNEHLFDVANQFNRGITLVVDPEETAQVAELALRAGRRGKASAAYSSASVYLAVGMDLLEEWGWGSRYELSFSLWLERAECEFLSGDFDKAEQLTAQLLSRAASKVDLAAVYQVKILLHTVKSENPEAVVSALTCLRLFGIDIPAHPTWEQVQAEYETVWQALEGRPAESLIDLPLMTDPELRSAMQLLSVLGPPAYFTDFYLFCLIACRTATISVRHGVSDASTLGFALVGFISGPVFHRYGDGYRFAKLAHDLVEKHRFVANRPKVYHAMGTVAFWTQPIETGIDLMRATTRAAIETGDLTFACYGMHQLVPGLLLRNDPLDIAWQESEIALAVAREANYGDTVDIIRSQQRFIATMQGRTATFSTFSDAEFDEVAFEAGLTGERMPLMICFYWILKLKARFMSGDYTDALAAANNAKPLLLVATAQIELLDYFFYGALTVAALFEKGSAIEQGAWRELLASHRDQLREWADTYPPTFRDKHELVSAEISRLEGRDGDAMRLYEQAIRSAHDNGLVQNEALAHELAARFYAVRGLDKVAHTYLRDARHCYLRWGAQGKVRHLEQQHPQLREDRAPARDAAMIPATVEQLDLGAVVKALHAISSEIVLDRLVTTLMTIALEYSGAERGLLILLRGGTPQIEAEARIDRKSVEVSLRQDPITPSDLPESLLHTVIRTRESVILDDASAANKFSADAYIRESHARSVLSLPLMKQGTLIGVLYLENNLASHAFTAERISVLELLSSQAAISLENARLYTQLIRDNRDRQTAEDALRRSEASLREAQQISHTGSWRWKINSDEVALSAELGRILAVDPTGPLPSAQEFLAMIHPDDRPTFRDEMERAVGERRRFEHEYRLVLADGTVKRLHLLGRPDDTVSDELEYTGVVMDVTERRQAEEALRDAQAELARAARLTTMGELAASIAHEINQPLAAIVTHGSAGLRWLKRDTPELEEARDAFEQVVRNGQRAADVIRGLRSLAKKSGPQITTLDIDDTIREVLTLTHGEVHRHGVALRTDLSVGNQLVAGDRVQLQQVLLNLMLNGVDAMKVVTDRVRELTVASAITDETTVLISIGDSGPGLDPTIAHRIFEPLVTTKPDGLGMGLSICRSIIDAHGGHLWVSPAVPFGTLFRFTVPTGAG